MLERNGYRNAFLRSPSLLNLRINLRNILGKAVELKHEKLCNESLELLKKENLTNKEKKKMRELANNQQFLLVDWSKSICYCSLCNSTSDDMLFYSMEKKWYCKKHIHTFTNTKHGFKTRRNSKYIYKVIEEFEDEGFIQMYPDPKKVSFPEPFKINEFLTLKYEDGYKTVIYVKDEEFIQCRYLLLNIPINQITELSKIESIDEATKNLNNSMEDGKIKIPPDVEFWGHCSNLQVWYENEYDTHILHSNLAFPLLKKLTEAGDPLAKKVFKEEIAKRYKSGFPSVVKYLKEEGYLNYLSKEELEVLN